VLSRHEARLALGQRKLDDPEAEPSDAVGVNLGQRLLMHGLTRRVSPPTSFTMASVARIRFA
jgi:hypothetical protein